MIGVDVLVTFASEVRAQAARDRDREAADQALLDARARKAWAHGNIFIAGGLYRTGTGNVRRIVELSEDVTYEDRCGTFSCPQPVFARGVSGPI
jgi:hypothetical protein